MDRVRFGYAMAGTEAYPVSTFEGSEYVTPHEEDFFGGLIEENRQACEELIGLTSFEKIVQAKKWRNEAKEVLTNCQDAVLITELCADKQERAKACSVILEVIAELVDYNLDYALDVLYRRCNIYSDCSPDFVRIMHGVSAQDNADMMDSVDSCIDDIFEISKRKANERVDSPD